MKPPRFPTGHEDRILELEEALEAPFLLMLELAMSAGYSEEETLIAIESLVDNRQLARLANAETADLLKRITRGD